jgi:hypothetical protein
MPASQAGFADLGGAVKDIFGAVGEAKSAKGYSQAAGFAEQNAEIAEQNARIQGVMAQRQITQTLGSQSAEIGGAGFNASGSALDLMRDSASQGALTKQLISNQGAINVLGYKAEAANYSSMASAAKSSAAGSGLGGIVSLAASAFAFFSDDRLKEGAVLIERRRDGVGIWEFNYKGSDQRFRGVMASEVERIYPRAVTYEGGMRKVDYARIDVMPEALV